jgi:ankyrin repeat protein
VKHHIQCTKILLIILQGAPLNEADHCGDPPLLLAAGNGHLVCCNLLLQEGADIEQRNVVRIKKKFLRHAPKINAL